MTRLKRYRRFLITLLAVDLVVLSLVFYYDVKGQIPDDYYKFVDTNDALELSLPVVIEGSVPALSINNAGTSFRVESRQKGEYQVRDNGH